MKRRAYPQKVDFNRDPYCRLLERLIARGMSYKVIERHTGFTNAQIGYRASKLRGVGISTTAYRNGTGEEARRVLSKLRGIIQACREVRQER